MLRTRKHLMDTMLFALRELEQGRPDTARMALALELVMVDDAPVASPAEEAGTEAKARKSRARKRALAMGIPAVAVASTAALADTGSASVEGAIGLMLMTGLVTYAAGFIHGVCIRRNCE